ncbi:hypothetical protein [Colwellia sp. Bg11-28]|uniref:hypothetical protein n=1 Tax=Colwellia sp. Bg11-28 TaxID=2058305 RepID=UPI000C329E51|nr:hypothetical protein [Colwellia sp. Bg11-28]PKH86233.1 hypothetical protein CXF79_16060 [Colwellia sp. Bg11-28]
MFFAVFKALRFEKTSSVYHEKELIKRYFEIKNIHSDYRIKYLRDWEAQAKLTVDKSEIQSVDNVIDLGTFKVIK